MTVQGFIEDDPTYVYTSTHTVDWKAAKTWEAASKSLRRLESDRK